MLKKYEHLNAKKSDKNRRIIFQNDLVKLIDIWFKQSCGSDFLKIFAHNENIIFVEETCRLVQGQRIRMSSVN